MKTENNLSMKNPYNSTIPIESLFKQIHNGLVFSIQAQQPYTLKKLATMGETAIFTTGIYEIDYSKWKARDPLA